MDVVATQECSKFSFLSFSGALCAYILLVLTNDVRDHDVATVHNTFLLIQPHIWHESCPCL